MYQFENESEVVNKDVKFQKFEEKITLNIHPKLLRTTDYSTKKIKKKDRKLYPEGRLDGYAALDRVTTLSKEIMLEAQEEVNVVDRENEALYAQEKQKIYERKIFLITNQYTRMEEKMKNQLIRETSRLIHAGNMDVQRVAMDMLDDVKALVLQKIDAMFNNPAHKVICEKLILVLIVQTSTRLAEPESLLIVRERDLEAARCVLPKARQKLRRLLGKRYIDTYLCDEHYLPENTGGGVALYNLCGTVWISNTFKDRIETVLFRHLHLLRLILYGPNPNRRFLD